MTRSQRDSDTVTGNPSIQASLGSLLADETRIRILQELYAASLEDSVTEGLTFSGLRRRVGVKDSGRFNYHLDQLCDQLVTKAGEEYRLTSVGRELVAALEEPS